MSDDASREPETNAPLIADDRAVGAIGYGVPADATTTRKRVWSWALWDWGSAAFNAVVTTFVFSTYLTSNAFIDPQVIAAATVDGVIDVKDPTFMAAKAANASLIATALLIAGVFVALIAPVLGRRSDGSGRRKLWLMVNTGLVVLAMAAMFFVEAAPDYLVLGATLLAVGNVFFEYASVNYNAMLVQVSHRGNVGKISGFGWGLGYVGGIVLLVILLVFFIGFSGAGLLGISSENGLAVRAAVLASAIWFALFALPLLFNVPEIPKQEAREKGNFFESYVELWRTIVALGKKSPQVLLFLLASAVFRDGLSGVFTFGAIIAATVFGFSTTEVLLFAVAANLVAGIGTFIGGWLDDKLGAKAVIIASLVGLVLAGTGVMFVGDAKLGFWILALILCLFVGPVQAASRSFLSRITPVGREGEIFGLYATTGRAVGFLASGLFALFVTMTGDTRYGILGIVIVLLAGLLLMLPVKAKQSEID